MPRVLIPEALRGPTRGQAELSLPGTTVGAVLTTLHTRYPDFGEMILSQQGALQRFVSLYVNGELLPHGALEHPLSDDDELEVVGALSGG
ncbi:MAG: MoaD/ThiS family protein [Myxococcales bacterium]|nr:MoaD/ThiS family protein [Myxococcales bacterium]